MLFDAISTKYFKYIKVDDILLYSLKQKIILPYFNETCNLKNIIAIYKVVKDHSNAMKHRFVKFSEVNT